MADWKAVRLAALSLPETREDVRDGRSRWRVRDKVFAWERPLRRSDLEALGKAAPTGPVLAVRVGNLLAKEGCLAANRRTCFTTPHFDGYPAVLVRLDAIRAAPLKNLIVEAWLARAPKKLVKKLLSGDAGDRSLA